MVRRRIHHPQSQRLNLKQDSQRSRIKLGLDRRALSGSSNETTATGMEGQFLSGVIEGFYGKPWTGEQRMKLFARLNKLGMNMYLYAPKDDIKHRSAWRELYTVEEMDVMSALIEAADRNNVNFVYALSPGIDMIYSSTADMNCLKRKFDQIQGIGCRAFALLFDDIKNELPDADRDHYQSLGAAQAMVTNEIFEHLQLPRIFLFCPTEYCTSRARPTIAESHYLQTIGSKLLPSIEIMWTGPKVVSRKISIRGVEELAEVLKRPPLIWDNIHANDYDYSRMFLGPFEGRSSELRPYVRGILTNPNCEFEANFVAFHTLAQWAKCSKDAVKKDIILTGSPVPAAELQLEMDGDFVPDDESPIHCCNQLYIPRRALKVAISEWHDEFLIKTDAPADFVYSYLSPLNVAPPVDPSMPTMALQPEVNDSIPLGFAGADPPLAVPNPEGSLSSSGDEKVDLNGEPMDCCTAASSGSADPSDVSDASTDDTNVVGEIMQIDGDVAISAVTLEDVALLVDLFYLPFEYGPQTTELLDELNWIISNIGHRDWTDRQGSSIKRLQSITDSVNRICNTPNKAILVEFYPYLWATKIVLSQLVCFLQWVGCGKVPASCQCFVHGGPATWSSQEYQVQLTSGDYEPWLMKGGFIRELQKMLPFECSSDLLVYACPQPSENVIFTVRPYQASDEVSVLDLYKRVSRTGNNNNLNSTATKDELQLELDALAEVMVGSFLNHNPEFCFVVENAQGAVCAYVLAALNAASFFENVESFWIPNVTSKYKEVLEKKALASPEEMMEQLEVFKNCLLDNQVSMYPSLLRIDFNPDELCDRTALKRALASTIAALKVNGSCGVYTQGPVMHERLREFYLNLGLFEIGFRDGVAVLGRNISLSHLISSPSSGGKPASTAKWCHMCYCCNVV